MESLNSYVMRKMKLRKILMIIFSSCTILLIFGICNYVMESGHDTEENVISNIDFAPGEAELKTDTSPKKNPRMVIMEKRDRKIRMYCSFILFVLMAGSFIADLLFIRCPVCSGHISYSINPSYCHNCGSSFARKEA